MKKLFPMKENGYLIGHNERYVKIGVLASEAAEKGYGENEIHEVLVEHVLV